MRLHILVFFMNLVEEKDTLMLVWESLECFVGMGDLRVFAFFLYHCFLLFFLCSFNIKSGIWWNIRLSTTFIWHIMWCLEIAIDALIWGWWQKSFLLHVDGNGHCGKYRNPNVSRCQIPYLRPTRENKKTGWSEIK